MDPEPGVAVAGGVAAMARQILARDRAATSVLELLELFRDEWPPAGVELGADADEDERRVWNDARDDALHRLLWFTRRVLVDPSADPSRTAEQLRLDLRALAREAREQVLELRAEEQL